MIAGLAGPVEPPRKNGELVFEAPWESRAFGMACVLHARGALAWDRFSLLLGEHLARLDLEICPETVLPVARGMERAYYTAWLAALEQTLDEAGIVSSVDLTVMAETLSDDH